MTQRRRCQRFELNTKLFIYAPQTSDSILSFWVDTDGRENILKAYVHLKYPEGLCFQQENRL